MALSSYGGHSRIVLYFDPFRKSSRANALQVFVSSVKVTISAFPVYHDA